MIKEKDKEEIEEYYREQASKFPEEVLSDKEFQKRKRSKLMALKALASKYSIEPNISLDAPKFER